jgi:hypothetical protein
MSDPTLEEIAQMLAVRFVVRQVEGQGEAAILAELIQAEARGYQRGLDAQLMAHVARRETPASEKAHNAGA